MSEQFPPTRPEPAQPWPNASNAADDATPTVQFPLYPQQPGFAPPIPYSPTPEPYPQAQPHAPAQPYQQQAQPFPPQPSNNERNSARPGPYGYATGYDAPAWTAPQPPQPVYQAYPPPPQYDPRMGGYVQHQPAGQLQPVVYQTVVQGPIVGAKSVGVAYVLWFFLGALGIHHFYLGRNGQGLAYLLLTVLLGWIGLGLVIVGIALLVDLFLIPTYTRDANYRLTGYRF